MHNAMGVLYQDALAASYRKPQLTLAYNVKKWFPKNSQGYSAFPQARHSYGHIVGTAFTHILTPGYAPPDVSVLKNEKCHCFSCFLFRNEKTFSRIPLENLPVESQ